MYTTMFSDLVSLKGFVFFTVVREEVRDVCRRSRLRAVNTRLRVIAGRRRGSALVPVWILQQNDQVQPLPVHS